MDSVLSVLGLYAGTFLVCVASALVPVVNSELFLLAVGATASGPQLPALTLLAALGQMTGKSVLYLGGRGVVHLRAPSSGATRWSDRLHRGGPAGDGLILMSAITGLPPFYAMSVGAGAVHWSFPRFLVAGTVGRLLRFGVVLALPALARELFR